MSERVSRRERRSGYAELIHLLNRRYHREWVRAELLQNDLDGMLRSPLWRSVAWLRAVKRWLVPRRKPAEPVLTEKAIPLVPTNEPRLAAGRISIVIPFRDRPELLRNCLRSLKASTYRRFEVVLVDNGSTDPRTHRLLSRSRRRVLDHPGAFNFSQLCNAGARHARGDWLLFLNNDTEVLARDWLEQLFAVGADPAVGVVGATLLYPDRTLQHVGLFPRADGAWVHPYRGRPETEPGADGELRVIRTVPAVTAACLLVRRDLFESLGGFDERLPLAFNDVDLCTRVRGRGLLVAITPHARLLHYEGLSRGYTVDTCHDR
jgi:GT2 family glycosyltransferase